MNLTPLQVDIKKQMGLITDHDVEWRFHWKFWQPVYIYARKHRFGRYCVVRERSYLSTQSTVGRMVVERGLAEDVHTATPMNLLVAAKTAAKWMEFWCDENSCDCDVHSDVTGKIAPGYKHSPDCPKCDLERIKRVIELAEPAFRRFEK